MLDLAHNAGDSIGEYVFSGSSDAYVAPPYEKLLINTLNMINYLETGDLNGAKVEARRLSVMQKYVRDELNEKDNAVLGLGGFSPGSPTRRAARPTKRSATTTKRSHLPATALSRADSQPRRAGHLPQPADQQALSGSWRKARPRPRRTAEATDGEVVFIVGYGRVPAQDSASASRSGSRSRMVSGDIHPHDARGGQPTRRAGARHLGNYPIARARARRVRRSDAARSTDKHGSHGGSGQRIAEVRAEWKKIEGKIIVSAITRLVARFAVGEGIQTRGRARARSRFFASLGAQATLDRARYARHAKLGDLARSRRGGTGAGACGQARGEHRRPWRFAQARDRRERQRLGSAPRSKPFVKRAGAQTAFGTPRDRAGRSTGRSR